ncbi:MAG: hypothetical protein HQL99_15220 [Magnetococcales bacterium]|nr:hypothetical protein [Magnetococcales bacterium]
MNIKRHTLILRLFLLFAICMSSHSSHAAPTAIIKPSTPTAFEGVTVTLDGSGSTFEPGSVTYLWTCMNCSNYGLTFPPEITSGILLTTPILSNLVPPPKTPSIDLWFSLTVTDNTGTHTTQQKITINKNTPPAAITSNPRFITILQDFIAQQGTRIQLDGSPSVYSSLRTATWTLVSWPSGYTRTSPDLITINNPNNITTSIDIEKGTTLGNYTFNLIITDTAGNVSTPASVTVQITSRDQLPPTVSEINIINQTGLPTVQTVPTNTVVTLTPGTITGSNLTYSWAKTSGSNVSPPLPNNTSRAITITTPATVGPLVFELTVTDTSNGLAVVKTVVVNVSNTTSFLPVAVATSDLTTAEEGETINLDASGSYDPTGGTIASYSWSASFPIVLSDATAKKPTFVVPNPAPASFVVSLQVTNANGFVGATSNITFTTTSRNLYFNTCATPGRIVRAATRTSIYVCITANNAIDFVELTPKHPSLLLSAQTATANTEPSDIDYGMFNFRVKTRRPGDLVTIDMEFLSPIPDSLTLWKHSAQQGWSEDKLNVVFSSDRRKATLTLVDGGLNDEDGLVNGFILDPAGFAQASTTATTSTATTSTGTISGDTKVGCTMNPGADLDPTFPVLLLTSLLYLYRQRKQNKSL